jgi:uncharacterized protein
VNHKHPAPAVASPCNNVCRIDAQSGWCLGCWRTIDEIAAWSRLGDERKQAIVDALPLRRGPSTRQGGPR